MAAVVGGAGSSPNNLRNPIHPDAKVKVCSGHTRPVPHIAYSGIVDGSFWFISSCHDGKPMLRNGETGDWVGTFDGHKGAVFCSAFNEPATQVCTASGDYTVKVWDAITGDCLHSWAHPHCVKFVDWYPDGTRIVSAAMDRNIRVFDAERHDAPPIAEFEGHDSQQKMTVFTGYDPNTIFSAAADNVVKRWDLRQGKESHQFKIEGLNCLEHSRCNRMLIVSSQKTVGFYRPDDLSKLHEFLLPEEADCADLGPNGTFFAVGSKLKAKEYLVQTGEELESHKGHHGPVFHLKYAPDSQSYASGSEDGMIRIWPTTTTIRKPDGAAKEGESM